MNLPKKKFNVGDIVNHIGGDKLFIILSYKFRTSDFNYSKDIKDINENELEPNKEYTGWWVLHLYDKNDRFKIIKLYAESNFELNIEETRNKKINELLNEMNEFT